MLYTLSPERFVFASEQRALARSGLIAPSVDPDVARRLLLDPFGVEGSERTLWRNVRRLQGGHSMWLRQGKLEIRRWWRTIDHLPELPKTDAERVERFYELFQDSVALRMRSDVPIGTCLSGGFDSTAVICTMAAHEKAGMGPRDSAAWRHAFVASFPGVWFDERPMAEEAARWANVNPTFVEIGSDDALTDIDRIIDDNDDVYIGLGSAVWQIYRELSRQNVTVSLDGHGADELMGAYRQEGQSAMFLMRNVLAGISSRSATARRGVDMFRTLMIKRQGHYFLRGGLRNVPAPLSLVGDQDDLPREWGSLNRRLYGMFHSTILPTILRNFDRLSMAHGIEVRMPFMDWRLVTYTMALPDASKSSDGYSKMIARRAMANHMPESIRMGRRKIGFGSPMPDWLNGPLSGWTAALLDKKVPAFAELVNEVALRETVNRLTASQSWDWVSAQRIWPYLSLKWQLGRLA
jgi:asparagine synthase (glutamine-hydrolysing)